MALEIDDATNASKKTPKKTKNTTTRVHLILDESGSMSHCRRATIDGFNEYVNGLRNDKNGNKYILSLSKFEAREVKRVFVDIPLKKVNDITERDYIPGGMTNLNDAIGMTLSNMENNKIRGKHNTLVIIMTDGNENDSQEWTQHQVSDLIKRKEKDGWTVTFLGANIDTQKVSSGYAIHIDNARSFTTKGLVGTMNRLGASTVLYAASANAGTATCDMFSEAATGISENEWMEEDTMEDASTVSVGAKLTEQKLDSSLFGNISAVKPTILTTQNIEDITTNPKNATKEEGEKDGV